MVAEPETEKSLPRGGGAARRVLEDRAERYANDVSAEKASVVAAVKVAGPTTGSGADVVVTLDVSEALAGELTEKSIEVRWHGSVVGRTPAPGPDEDGYDAWARHVPCQGLRFLVGLERSGKVWVAVEKLKSRRKDLEIR